MNASELSKRLSENVLRVVEALLPDGRKSGSEWCVGSIGGESGKSLRVHLSGEKKGIWSDFSTNESGDLLDLWMHVKGVSLLDAIKDAKTFLGIQNDLPKREVKEYKRPSKPKCSAAKLDVKTWLESRGLTEKTISDFKIAEIVKDGKAYAVFPFLRDGELINCKYRNVLDKKDMRQESGAEPCLFGWHLIGDKERSIAITEGEIDCMTLHQIGIPTLSVNAGAGNHQWIENDWNKLEIFDTIYLCFDSDDIGKKSVKEVANRLGLERCKLVFFSTKDANDFLLSGAADEDFKKCFRDSRTLDPEELKPISDYRDKIIDEFYPGPNSEKEVFLSICGRKQFWFRFRRGQLTVWTGYNGHGKSLLLNQVLIGLMTDDEKACVFSGEMSPVHQGKRLIKQLGGVNKPTVEYMDYMFNWVRDRMWIFDLLGSATIDRLLTVFSYAYKRYGITQFVIDSLMMTDVPEDGNGALTKQKEAMQKLSDFAKHMNVHVHLVAHSKKAQNEDFSPGKMDVAGSAKITNLADNVFSVWSAQKEDGDISIDKPDGFLNLKKQRTGDVQVKSIALFFNKETGQYSMDHNRRAYTYLDYRK